MRFNLSNLVVPDTWDTLDDFVNWYIAHDYPFRIEDGSPTFVTDVTYSSILFRHSVYSVEMYMGAHITEPTTTSTKHTHPFQHRTMICAGDVYGRRGRYPEDDPPFAGPLPIGVVGAPVNPGEWHQLTTTTGFLLLVFCKWDTPQDITSAVLAYGGDSLGPAHDELRSVAP